MKLLILFVLLIAFSVLCSMIFTTPTSIPNVVKLRQINRLSEFSAFVCICWEWQFWRLLLIMERLSAGRPLSCGSGFIFPSGIILSGNNANINAGWSLNERGNNGQSKFVAGCKSKKKAFGFPKAFFMTIFWLR